MVGARRCVATVLVALAGGAGQVVGAVEGVGGQGGWLPLARSADGQSTWEAQVGSAVLAAEGGDVTFAAVVRVDGVRAVLTVSLRECRAGEGRVRVDGGAGFAYRTGAGVGAGAVGDRVARVLCGLGLAALRLTI